MDRGRNTTQRHDPLAAHLVPAALTLSAALAIVLLMQLMPAQQMLPAISLFALAGGGVVALYARLRRPQIRPNAINAWDVSGALVLIGCATAMVSEPGQITALFGYPAAST